MSQPFQDMTPEQVGQLVKGNPEVKEISYVGALHMQRTRLEYIIELAELGITALGDDDLIGFFFALAGICDIADVTDAEDDGDKDEHIRPLIQKSELALMMELLDRNRDKVGVERDEDAMIKLQKLDLEPPPKFTEKWQWFRQKVGNRAVVVARSVQQVVEQLDADGQ